MKGKRDRAAPYVALFEYLGWRVAKKETQASAALANEALTELQTQLNPGQWPLPVVKYLRRELSAEGLLKQASNNDEQTEARAYLGCDLSLSGKPDEAVPHLQTGKQLCWCRRKPMNVTSFMKHVLHCLEEIQGKMHQRAITGKKQHIAPCVGIARVIKGAVAPYQFLESVTAPK